MTTPAGGNAGRDRLRSLDRALVAVLGSVLPAQFRARQRAEWTADLLVLASRARRSYLLGAARTLPTLRAAARRAPGDHAADFLRPPSLSAVVATRVLTIGLGWTVLAWLIMLPGRYLFFDVPARQADGSPTGDAHAIWSAGDGDLHLLPLRAALNWGALAATVDAPLIPFLALLTIVILAVSARPAGRRPLEVTAIRVIAIAIAAIATALTLVDLFLALILTAGGPALPVTGLIATALAVTGSGVSRRARVLLGLVGLAAVAVAVIDSTVGLPMVVWFRD